MCRVLTSAPFDNWWHNAYGLDVKIVSPPHALLILGLRGISTGVMFLILAAMNRSAQTDTSTFRLLQLLFLYVGGLAIVGQMFFMQEYTWDVKLHQAAAYIAMGIGLPFFFSAFSEASRARWAATFMAAVYTVMVIAEILILPLFRPSRSSARCSTRSPTWFRRSFRSSSWFRRWPLICSGGG